MLRLPGLHRGDDVGWKLALGAREVLVAYGKLYWPEYRAIADLDSRSGHLLLDADPNWTENQTARV